MRWHDLWLFKFYSLFALTEKCHLFKFCYWLSLMYIVSCPSKFVSLLPLMVIHVFPNLVTDCRCREIPCSRILPTEAVDVKFRLLKLCFWLPLISNLAFSSFVHCCCCLESLHIQFLVTSDLTWLLYKLMLINACLVIDNEY